jgi:hypothetical protein
MMPKCPNRLPHAIVLGLFITCGMAIGQPGHAQQSPDSGSSVTERLIELLVQKGVLQKDQAAALLKQAQREARDNRRPAPQPVAHAEKTPARPASVAQGLVAPSVPPGTVRVTYVPQIVRDQIAAEVRGQVMQQAKSEGWAAPGALPEWTQRLTVFGDVRVRAESDMLSKSNDPLVPDFQSINAGSGYDTNSGALPPLLDTTQNRDRMRLRARLGVDARIDDGVSAELRIATGNDNSPVTTNQTLGQNGPFDKYALWLDRAFIKDAPADWMTLYAGRMTNPYWTSNLVYVDDLGFDGVAISATPRAGNALSGFFTVGAFPVFNTAFNFATTASPKYASHDAWLLGLQGGGDWRISDRYDARIAAGYFSYSNIQGKTSAPCTLIFSSDSCSTDDTRTLFRQFGNTMFPIRNITPNPTATNGGAMPQYYGLASQFDVLDLHGRFDIDIFKPIVIALEGDFATNLAYNRAAILGHGPANNFDGSGQFKSGANAYMLRVAVGTPTIARRWDWNLSLAYKYLEADSVLDALTDSDFHLGGTNAKGYVLSGNLGIARNTWLTAAWYSTDQVSGTPYGVDTVQVDLNVRF